MPITMIDSTGPMVSAKVSGELSKSEVSQMQAAALEAIRRCGKISALFILENFRGWKREGEWGDIRFLIEYDKDIAKIAVVGDEKWRDLVYAFLAKGFRGAAVEFFGWDDLDKARQQSQDIDKIFRLAIDHPGRKEMESWSNSP